MNQPIKTTNKKIVSFSAINQYNFCPFSYKLKYIDNVSKFKGNEHTCFGKALHKVLECLALDKIKPHPEPTNDLFLDNFLKEINKLPELERNSILDVINEKETVDPKKQKVIPEMIEKGGILSLSGFIELSNKFPGYSVVSAEKKEETEIKSKNIPEWYWKQYTDLILRTPDNIHHITDWKSCSWGWNSRKKNDKMVVYQLALYKHFYSILNNIPLENIKTYFGLLKRTARKECIEIFEVSTGNQRIKNALTKVEHFIYNVEKKVFPKKRLKCEWCDFYKTEHCPSAFGNNGK